MIKFKPGFVKVTKHFGYFPTILGGSLIKYAIFTVPFKYYDYRNQIAFTYKSRAHAREICRKLEKEKEKENET